MGLKDGISRRGFVGRLIGILAAAAASVPFYRYLTPDTGAGDILLRVASDEVPEGGALVYKDKQVALLRSGGDTFALSMTCTHLGCTVSLDGDRFVCPCHGSRFALDGSVLEGPAVKKLPRFVMTEESGELTVYRREMS